MQRFGGVEPCVERVRRQRRRLGRDAGHREDAPHARGEALLGDDRKAADDAGARDMRAAAELRRLLAPRRVERVLEQTRHRRADRDDPHRIGVPLAEDRAESADRLRLFKRRRRRLHGEVLRDRVVDDPVDLREFRRREGLRARVVEAKPIRRDERAALVALGAGDPPQREVQQVRAGVVRLDHRAAVSIDRELRLVAHAKMPALDADLVDDEAAAALRVEHFEHAVLGAAFAAAFDPHRTGVADLTAALGVEAGAIEDDAHRLAGLGPTLEPVTGPDRLDAGHDRLEVVLRVVVGERRAGLLELREHVGRQRHRVRLAALAAGAARGAGLAHELLVAGEIDREPMLSRHHLGQVDRESVGVVQLEGVLAADAAAFGAALCVGKVQESALERAQERPFFFLEHARDAIALLEEFRERLAEGRLHRGQDPAEERFALPELLVRMAHRAAQDPPQHVAAAFVRGRGAVGDRDREAAHVVGEHAVGDVGLVLEVGGVGLRAARGADRLEDRREDLGVVVAALALDDRDEPLEAHAGVDVLRRQRLERAVRLAIELDEDEVPDLEDVGVARVDERRRVASADAVEVDLRAGAARAGLAHLPEVVLHRARQHPLRGQVLAPEIPRLDVRVETGTGVAAEVGRVEPRGIESVDLGQQFPRPVDRLGLEVVPEGPVAEHLEEGVVIGVASDVLEVVVLAAGADALLRVGGAAVRAGALSKEDVLELVHPRVREEERRILVRHDRRTRDDGVAAAFAEEVEERRTDRSGGGRSGGRRGGHGVDGEGRVRSGRGR